MATTSDRVAVDVALLPSLAREIERKVCIVVDVLRAATTLSVMAQSGVGTVVITSDPPSARQAANELSAVSLLCGESGGLKPEDFDLGNSPYSYRDPTLRDRSIVFCSSNGARALHVLAIAPVLLVGALVNARAVAEIARQAARERGLSICLVCSGEAHGTLFSLEDTFGAGLIVERLLELNPPGALELDDAAIAALRLCRGYRRPGATGEAGASAASAMMFEESSAARMLRSWGLDVDVRACGNVDSIEAVMRVTAEGGWQVARPVTSALPSSR